VVKDLVDEALDRGGDALLLCVRGGAVSGRQSGKERIREVTGDGCVNVEVDASQISAALEGTDFVDK
jgi:hypothetical protein